LSRATLVVRVGLTLHASDVAENVVLLNLGAVRLLWHRSMGTFTPDSSLHPSGLGEHSSVAGPGHIMLGLRILWEDVIGLKTYLSIVRLEVARDIFSRRRRRQGQARMLLLQDDRVHPIHRAICGAVGKEFLALDSGGNNVADQRIFLGQVGGEVHLLPLEALADAQPWEAEVAAYGGALDEVEQTI